VVAPLLTLAYVGGSTFLDYTYYILNSYLIVKADQRVMQYLCGEGAKMVAMRCLRATVIGI